MLLIIFTKSSLVFCAMDFGFLPPQFCTPQLRFATQKNNREYALAHPRFVILLYVHLKCLKTHHSTHRQPGFTVERSPIVTARLEVEPVRAVRNTLCQRTRPIVADRTSAETATFAPTRSGEENAITIRACHLITIDAVLSYPSPSRII